MGGGGTVDRRVAVPGARRRGRRHERIVLDHVGGNGDNWSAMFHLIPFAARARST